MPKNKLSELKKIVGEKIVSLEEEVEIRLNVKLNPLYIADRQDEIEFLYWIIRIIQPILIRNHDEQQLRINKNRSEMMQTIEFENILQGRVEELNLKFKVCNNLRQSDNLINEIDTLESVLGRLSDLKYGNKTRDIGIADANLITLQP